MAREGWAAASEAHGVASASAAAAAASSSSARSWILLDFTGEEKVLDVDKYAIMQRVQIHARDLRIIDPLLSYPSSILARERAIVLNLEHIKAIITVEEVLIRDPYNENVIPLVEELRRRLAAANVVQRAQGKGSGQNMIEAAEEDGESPFEFRALEVALEAICSFLDARTTDLETAAYPALDELTSKISCRNLDRVRKLKSAMTRLTARTQKVRDELEQLLDDDNDMADLYLSRKMAGASSPNSNPAVPNCLPASQTTGSKMLRSSRASSVTFHGNENDVEELEMLLEAYFRQIDSTFNHLTTALIDVSKGYTASSIGGILDILLREYVDDTEDYINFQLDNHRNQLIQLELFLNGATVALTFYSLVAGIFGMNIPYSWNDNHGYIFKWVVGISGLVSGLLFIFVVFYARYRGLIGS